MKDGDIDARHERHLLAQDSKRLERLFRELVENSIQGVLVARRGVPLFANRVLAEMFGYTIDEVMALPSNDALYHSSERARIGAFRNARLAGDRSVRRLVAQGQRKDGSTFWFEQLSMPIDWFGQTATQVVVVDITERKRADHQLAAQVEKYRKLFEDAPIAMYRAGRDRKFLEVNKKFEELLGYSAAEMVGRRPREFIPAEETAAFAPRLAALWDGKVDRVETEHRMIRKDGSVIWVVSSASLSTDIERESQSSIVHIQDVTERRAAQDSLRDREQEYRENFENAPVAMVRVDRDRRIINVNSAFASMLGHALEDLYGKRPGDFMPAEEYAVVWATLKKVWTGEAEQVAVEHSMRRKDGTVIWVESSCNLTPDDSGQLNHMLSRFFDVTRRRDAEAAVREREEIYRTLVDKSLQGVLVAIDGKPVFANDVLARMFGYRVNEILGFASTLELCHPSERARIRDLIVSRASGDASQRRSEVQGIKKDGTPLWIEFLANPVDWFGRRGVQVVMIDVTERRNAERLLAQRERTYREAFENAPIAMIRAGRNRKIIEVNRAFRTLLGYTQDELVGKLGRDFVVEHQRAHSIAEIDAVWRGERERVEVENILRRKDGRFVTVLAIASLTSDERGEPNDMLVQFQDITARRAAEEAVKRREASYRGVVDNSIQGIALVNSTGFVFANDAFCKIFGYSRDELTGMAPWMFHPDNREELQSRARERAEGDLSSRRYEIRGRKKDGSVIWVEYLTCAAEWHGERATQVVAIDVTDRKDADRRVAEQQKLYRETFENAPVAMYTSVDRRILKVNHALEELLGYSADEMIGRTRRDFMFPEDARTTPNFGPLRAGPIKTLLVEHRMVRKDGRTIWVLASSSVVPGEHPQARNLIVQLQDVTARREAEEALKERESIYRSLVDQSLQGVLVTQVGKPLFANEVFARMFGYSAEEIVRTGSVMDFYHPSERARMADYIRSRQDGDDSVRAYEIQCVTKDGTSFWVRQLSSPVDWFGQRAVQVVSLDITERKLAEQRLADSERQYRELFDHAPVAMCWVSPEGEYVRTNRALQDMLGYSAEEFLQMHPLDTVHPDYYDEALRAFVSMAAGGDDFFVGENRHVRKDGREIWVLVAVRVIRDSNGQLRYILTQLQDITERKNAEDRLQQAQQQLADREQQYRELFENAPVAMGSVSLSGEFIQTNQAYRDMLGYSESDLAQIRAIETVHPKDRADVLAAMDRSRQGIGPIRSVSERQLVRKDGQAIWVLLSASVIRDADEQPRYILSHLQDVTARKIAEEQLFQSQKMEALGNLAGGIAHDFNNMLLPIMALTEITHDELPPDNPGRENLETVLEAANQACKLVQQILTFSRQHERQVDALEISQCISDALGLLRNVLPSTIHLRDGIVSDVGTVMADRAQLLSVVMNLGSNALDAMQGKVGELHVGLERVVADQDVAIRYPAIRYGAPYAKLTVRDTGTGIDGDTLDKIFNPFFTTKPVGEGTGLGLAMVHGIIEGLQGAIGVASEIDVGTTFDIYLPLCTALSTPNTDDAEGGVNSAG